MFCAQAGIDEVTNDLTHSVYPNPADNYMTIVFADANETHTVQLLDLSGRVMKSIQTSNAEYTIEKCDINAGNYILKVSNNAGQVSIQHVMFY